MAKLAILLITWLLIGVMLSKLKSLLAVARNGSLLAGYVSWFWVCYASWLCPCAARDDLEKITKYRTITNR